MGAEEGLPVLPHVAGEFYTWLWWTSETRGSAFDLEAPVGPMELWVDERLAFRNPDDTRLAAVMTGENPAATLEAKAALAGGKVLQELRVGMRRDDREYMCTLKGPSMHLQGLKLPQVVDQGGAEVLFERMHLYEEAVLMVEGLFRAFCAVRTSSAWTDEVLPALHDWVLGVDEPTQDPTLDE
jgi:hypothetical protein